MDLPRLQPQIQFLLRRVPARPSRIAPRLHPAGLGNPPARTVVCHRHFVQSITGYSRRLRHLYKFNRHTSPIIGNFQELGIAQSAIHCGSAIKMHKCIFAALTLQVFVLDEIARSIVYKVAVDGYFDLRGKGGAESASPCPLLAPAMQGTEKRKS